MTDHQFLRRCVDLCRGLGDSTGTISMSGRELIRLAELAGDTSAAKGVVPANPCIIAVGDLRALVAGAIEADRAEDDSDAPKPSTKKAAAKKTKKTAEPSGEKTSG